MKYKIYIQSLNNFPIADWGVSAYMGFREKQSDIYFFENIEEVPVNKNNIVVGFIEDTNKYFEKLGIPPKLALNIPDCLYNYAERDVFITDLKHLRNGDVGLPIFVKPANKSKQFIAGVITKSETISVFDKWPEETPIFLQRSYRYN